MTSTMMALWSPWKNPRWTISSRRWMFVLHDCIEENNVMLMLVLLIFLFRLLILLLLFVLLLLMYSFSYSWTYIRLRKSETALTRSRPVWRRSRGSTAPFSPLLKRMRVGNPVSTAAPALEDFYSCFWSCLFCCLCFYWFYYWYFFILFLLLTLLNDTILQKWNKSLKIPCQTSRKLRTESVQSWKVTHWNVFEQQFF